MLVPIILLFILLMKSYSQRNILLQNSIFDSSEMLFWLWRLWSLSYQGSRVQTMKALGLESIPLTSGQI